MRKRLAAGAVILGAAAASLCVHLQVNVNGQGQTVDQCLPPAS